MPLLASTVKIEWFSFGSHRAIFRILTIERVVFTRSSLRHAIVERKGKRPLLLKADKLMKLNLSSTNIRSVRMQIRQMFDLYRSRTVAESAFDLLKGMARKDTTMSDIGKNVTTIHRVWGSTFGEDDRSGEILEDYERQAREILYEQQNLADGERKHIPTGLNRFDALIGDGVLPGEFGVIIGKPAVGKTAAMVSFAIHAWRRGCGVLFISGEMAKRDIMHRMYSNLTGIPSQKFRKRNLAVKDYKAWARRIRRLRREQEAIPLEIVGMNRNFSTESVRDEIDRTEEKWGSKVDLICVDYLNIMSNPQVQSGSREWASQTEVVWDIKVLCEERGIVCWTASQINDSGVDAKTLSLSHVKYSRAIAETAPIVVGLLRDEEDELEGRIRLQVLKLRNAPSIGDMIPLNPDLERMRIHTEVIPTRDENYLDTL